MKTSRLLAAALVLLGAIPLLAQAPPAPRPEKKAPQDKTATPLVRMDLLRKPPVEAAPPGRNIFSPRPGVGAAGAITPPALGIGGPGPGTTGLLPANPDGAPGDAAARAPDQPNAAPGFAIDLRYVGFVGSQRTHKMIGLVVFQGQARAVMEGEVISEGIRIGKISRKDIEVIAPDSTTRTFFLEGEER
jgi:hypothetical protein